MKIQDDLVWDKHTGELIGFVDLGDTDLNYATLKKVDSVAFHVLVFMVKSVVNPLSYSFAIFSTHGVTCDQLFPIFWRAVAILEMRCYLKVIATSCDGAPPNRTFFRMHKSYDNSDRPVTYKSPNMYADEERYICFFSDPPHLIKTTRNCLSSSGAGRNIRFMWNDGMLILWTHISNLYKKDSDCGLQYMPKLRSDHINLTAYSIMNVRLATQVLSETVGKILFKYGPPDAAGTSKFCILMDQCFDCCNVRNTIEAQRKDKKFLRKYDDANDEKFLWLEDVFLKYFSDWQQSILMRPGKFSAADHCKMFISWQTHEGLQITCYSLIEYVKFLLQSGVNYVLSEKFCQDDLENYFGKQRAIGCRRDNPTVRDVGYNDNTIKSQFSIKPW